MTDVLNCVGAGVTVDGKDYFYRRGDSLDDVPYMVLRELREMGALASEGEVPESVPDGESPLMIPDVRDATAAQLAAYMDSANLTAPDTVALADNDPELAGKVLEAERLSTGGDGRVTVVGPLEKLAEKQGH